MRRCLSETIQASSPLRSVAFALTTSSLSASREGLERACSFSWHATAERVLTAYADAAVRS